MDKKENKPLYISFSTQKGGAGKTTLTVLIASYLHYVKNLNVAIIDCDFPQYSIKDMRERDMNRFALECVGGIFAGRDLVIFNKPQPETA